MDIVEILKKLPADVEQQLQERLNACFIPHAYGATEVWKMVDNIVIPLRDGQPVAVQDLLDMVPDAITAKLFT